MARGSDPNLLWQAIESITETAIAGRGPLKSAETLAREYRFTYGNAEAAIPALVRAEVRKAAGVGFATGLGGVITLPVALPANIVGAALIEARMVAAIAELRGWDADDPKVQRYVQACLVGQRGVDALKQAGVKLTTRVVEPIVVRMAMRRAITQTGVHALGKAPARMVPVVGGVVGGAVDAAVAKSIAKLAMREFPPRERVGPAGLLPPAV